MVDVSRPDALAYARLFEGTPDGPAILEDLIRRFGGSPYVRGGLDAERETLVRIGQRRPVDFILARINAAHGVPDDDQPSEDEDAR